MFKEGPFSKSKGIGIWGDEAIEIEKADYWRYYLISTRPEMKDTYFDWREFGNAINVDLNDVIGNFIHRTVTFISQHFDGKIPERGKLGDEEEKLFSEIEKSVQDYKNAMDSFKLKEAANAILVLARKGNLYLSTTQPWHLIKKDKAKAGQVLNISAKIAETVSLLLWPIVPSASEKLWEVIGFKGIPPDTGIDYLDVNLTNEGQEVKKSQPIFGKVKVKEVEEKLAELRGRSKKEKIKMENKRKVNQERISFKEFQKMKLKVAIIKHAEEIEKSKNLIKLIVDLGTEERQILAGIKQHYKAEDLIGRQIVVIVNLEPATLMGEKSDGMLMAADIDGEPILLQPEREVPPGTPIK
ncbi:Methionine--tRNA ligase [subsurface metagenome]